MGTTTLRPERLVADGFTFLEGPRWREGRLYCSDMTGHRVLRIDPESGARETVAEVPEQPSGLGWLPDGRLLVVSMRDRRLLRLEALPEEAWDPEALVGGVWTVFPHVSIADFEAGGKIYMVSQLFPGTGVGESLTIQSFLATTAPDDAGQAEIARTMQFLLQVVRDEDYATGLRIQRALEADPNRDVLFGRNEWGGQRFHRFVAVLLRAEDPELPALFAAGVG